MAPRVKLARALVFSDHARIDGALGYPGKCCQNGVLVADVAWTVHVDLQGLIYCTRTCRKKGHTECREAREDSRCSLDGHA
eukprot:scaffold62716_cov36-Tisochrysis_lutea.AAC.2